MPERPTRKDWVQLQGGKPSVTKEGSLTVVIHDYEGGNGIIVKSHKNVEDYGTVLKILPSGKVAKFPTALVREHHGDPCERESLRAGGEGYDRK